MGEHILIRTHMGDVKVRLRPDVAPKTCAAIKQLVSSGLYDGCCFYRAEPGFVVQGGLRLPDGSTKESPLGKLLLEYNLKNTRGTVTMARWGEPDSATSEFFINLGDSTHLDRSGDDGWSLGFTVWGEVVSGMEICDKIGNENTQVVGGLKMLVQPIVFNAEVM
mmetsp:Transcript_40782/g.68334  ORF Transcript_40782/g.68334 Transcript_40782/m.68334 type:complete len:164 (-) Transcript_40782:159-650(-)|eukprot:CAMPEP_0198216172 /NCGR_PEP_ID=MMETSP1445-20131203/55526_1 /TAXON_ID=36898 /ORGANISM="Pyramimonas sp., Strain CCMP2087" /LENGTH=163 /DNA_ID=CAMNT_0043892285 /DNA_START=58 /DNA_END=549 /DNA_ORIENTATION=+